MEHARDVTEAGLTLIIWAVALPAILCGLWSLARALKAPQQNRRKYRQMATPSPKVSRAFLAALKSEDTQ